MSLSFPHTVAGGHWTDHFTFVDNAGREFLTEIGASARFSVPRTVIRRFRTRLHCVRVTPPIIRADPLICLYAVDDGNGDLLSLRAFVKSYSGSARRSKEDRGKSDKPELSCRDIEMEYGIAAKVFCRYWSRKGSIRRADGEPALRMVQSSDLPHRGRGKHPTRLFLRDDVEAILRGEESADPRVGRSGRVLSARLSNADARTAIQRFVLEHGPVKQEKVEQFARQKGISHEQLRQVRRQLTANKGRRRLRCEVVGGGRNKGCYWCLDRQKPPRLQHCPRLQRAVAFLRRELADGLPHLKQVLLQRAEAIGLFSADLLKVLSHLDIVRKREPYGAVRYSTWRLRDASPPPPTDEPSPNGQGAEPPPPDPGTRKRRGRKRSRHAQELGQFCYDLLKQETKRRTICRMVRERFSRIMEEPDVTIYARRYAQDNDLPWPL